MLLQTAVNGIVESKEALNKLQNGTKQWAASGGVGTPQNRHPRLKHDPVCRFFFRCLPVGTPQNRHPRLKHMNLELKQTRAIAVGTPQNRHPRLKPAASMPDHLQVAVGTPQNRHPRLKLLG